jgi:hypothetical protein
MQSGASHGRIKSKVESLMINKLQQDKLIEWPRPIKRLLIGFLLLLTSGVTIGIIFLFTTTSFSTTGTIEQYNGSPVPIENTLLIPENYAKPFSELLLTTHNHFIGFSFIFFIVCGLFYFNSTITGRLKNFFLIEPFISTWITFASIWGLRYIDPSIVYITFIAALLTYASFYFLVFILMYELTSKK